MAFDVTELLQVEDIGRCDCRLSQSPGTSQADDMKKQPSWQDLYGFLLASPYESGSCQCFPES